MEEVDESDDDLPHLAAPLPYHALDNNVGRSLRAALDDRRAYEAGAGAGSQGSCNNSEKETPAGKGELPHGLHPWGLTSLCVCVPLARLHEPTAL